MKITIEYESSWRNSFLSDEGYEDNTKRKFIATSKELAKSAKNFKSKEITHDTVMGVLNRLIGEQKKLYNARKRYNYYYSDFEEKISFNDDSFVTEEVVYLRNISKDSDDPKAYTGIIKASDSSFTSDYSVYLWGIIFLSVDKLLDYVVRPDFDALNEFENCIDPISIKNRLSNLKGKIPVSNNHKNILDILQKNLCGFRFNCEDGKINLSALYAATLYWQMEQLKKIFDISTVLSPTGKLTGIALSGRFTEKDFMARYSTGGNKKSWGSPYLLGPQKITDVPRMLTKANGTLEINLNISKEQALDLQQKILNAGVSSIYLGKKGLAYVTDIIV